MNKDIFLHYLRYKVLHSTQPFYIIFHKTNGYIKDYDESKYLKLIPSNEKGKNLIKK